MNTQELMALLDRLRAEPRESEWLEFKTNVYEALGEYISALANSACLLGKPRAFLVFGIADGSHAVVGTNFDPATVMVKNKEGKNIQPLTFFLSQGLKPNVGFEIYPFIYQGCQIVLFEIHPATDQPVKFYDKAYIRDGASKADLERYPEKARQIWQRRVDWSAQLCGQATLDDLEPAALVKARLEYKNKFPGKSAEVDGWDNGRFLDKAKLTIRGGITNAAMVLLGREESTTLLAPSVARISWILKDEHNGELDYQHFGPPFLLNVDKLLARIRNLTVRELPEGTLFPVEMTQYDPWVIREALHNCIAHQDYGLRGRINVVETPQGLTLTNVGGFLPGSVEKVIEQDAPLEIYRNPFLAEAMVNLNMIDTQGGGIKRMFLAQRRRFFPMPDYDLSQPERVVVNLQGRILDERYTRLLMSRTDLDLGTIMLLDRVQKKQPISADDNKRLKAADLVGGRYPNLVVGAAIAAATGQEAKHILNSGFDNQHYRDLIVKLVRKHQPVTREKIDEMLLDKLPEVLSKEQKLTKIHNLLSSLSGKRIRNDGVRGQPKWVLIDSKNKQ